MWIGNATVDPDESGLNSGCSAEALLTGQLAAIDGAAKASACTGETGYDCRPSNFKSYGLLSRGEMHLQSFLLAVARVCATLVYLRSQIGW